MCPFNYAMEISDSPLNAEIYNALKNIIVCRPFTISIYNYYSYPTINTYHTYNVCNRTLFAHVFLNVKSYRTIVKYMRLKLAGLYLN